ncbi:MFS transporter [Chitinophaga dinghuensis]|uniref:MFS transporter n=1 Tax=Chitinophaga dinghuensis TaxID=1539050 RepID=A0A327W6N7_9BACT|nr:MFS transporter [Chitinophaga dinghuensis]RAJ83674.1 MFS transporter [Chitinophaga dinghuensis]
MDQSTTLIEPGFRRFIIRLVAFFSLALAVMNLYIADSSFNEIMHTVSQTTWSLNWISIIYSLGCLVIMPFCTGLAGLLGQRKLFLLTFLIFAIFSFCSANATHMNALLIFRFFQGIAGGSMIILSHTLLIESWPTEKRGIAQLFALLAFSSIIFARTIGGSITDDYSWPIIFIINIPWCIILGTAGLVIPRNVEYERQEDWMANLLLMTGAAALYLGVKGNTEPYGAITPLRISLCIVGIISWTLFIWRHFRTASRQGKVALLKNKNVAIGLGLGFITIIGVIIIAEYILSSSRLSKMSGEMPLWPVVPLTIVMIFTIALTIRKMESMKYLIGTGFLLFGMTILLSILRCYAEVFWLVMSATMAIALLSFSLTTLTFSKLHGRQVSEAVALYNIIMKLAIVLGYLMIF